MKRWEWDVLSWVDRSKVPQECLGSSLPGASGRCPCFPLGPVLLGCDRLGLGWEEAPFLLTGGLLDLLQFATLSAFGLPCSVCAKYQHHSFSSKSLLEQG